MALAFASTTMFAQDLTSKKGEPMLPEAGDWAIGFDAVPFLTYAGNLFSGSTGLNGSPNANWINSSRQTIIGKMFKDEKTAYRVQLRIGFGSTNEEAQIADATFVGPAVFPTPPPMVTDAHKNSSHYVGLGGGMEWRRGKTRLQGFYGGDLLFWMDGSKDTYTYGNNLSTTVTAAASTNFGANMTTDAFANVARVTEQKNGSTIGLGLRGFIGCEYFILPKISVGAEYGWGLGFSKTGETEQTIESVGGAGPAPGTATMITVSKQGGFSLDTDLNGNGSGSGSLVIMFHF